MLQLFSSGWKISKKFLGRTLQPAMFSVSCSQMMTLFGRIGQLVYHIFLHVISYLYAFFFRFKNTVEMRNYRAAVLEVVIMTVDKELKLLKS